MVSNIFLLLQNAARLDSEIIYDRDFDYDYFGFKTLERSYLLKVQGKVVERPQHMLMRVAVGIHKDDIDSALKTYHLMSQRWFTHASPTLFNAGTPRPQVCVMLCAYLFVGVQISLWIWCLGKSFFLFCWKWTQLFAVSWQLSSCFLVCMKDDSIEGIYDTLKECAVISKSAGGIGVSVHNIRATGSYIRGTNGTSNGIVPMLRVFNDTARYVDQGGGKRKGMFIMLCLYWHFKSIAWCYSIKSLLIMFVGAFAVYLEPWHADVFEFLDLRKNHGKVWLKSSKIFHFQIVLACFIC